MQDKNKRIRILYEDKEVLNIALDDDFKELTFTSNQDKFKVIIEKLNEE